MLIPALLRKLLFPLAERLTRTRFWSYYAESLRYERWSGEEREALRSRRLNEVLNAALGSALHRQRLEEAGLSARSISSEESRPFLEGLRPVSKADFRRHFPTGVTTSQDAADWRYLSTAGTTDRMTVIADFAKRDYCRSSELHALRLLLDEDVGVSTVEIPPNACNVVCGLVDGSPPTFGRYAWHALRRGSLFGREARTELRGRFERQFVLRLLTLPPIAPAPAGALAQTLGLYLDQIAQVGPAYLRGYPLYLMWLADSCRDHGRALKSLRVAAPFGGLASPAMAARIGAGLGARFGDKYGTSELGTVAASCGQAPGMHIFEDLFIVEALHKGRPVEPGQVGRLVMTDLTNSTMPLLRYDVGDVGRVYAGPCPCGRTTARLEVLGRVQEVLASPAGNLTASDVADTFFADAAIANFRLEETAPGSFEAAVVARPGGSVPDLRAWQERFAALHTGVAKIRARTAPFVQPEPNGKYRFVFPALAAGDLL
jgi:phenylacetate-CoA ligase